MSTVVFISAEDDPERWRRALEPHLPGLDWRVWPDAVGDAAEVTIALVWRPKPGAIKDFPNLKAVYNLGAGVEMLLADDTLPRHIPLIRMVDPALTAGMTEYVVHRVLHYHRRFDLCAHRQRDRVWKWMDAPQTAKRRVGILGLGVLGRDAAEKLIGLGFRALAGWSRTPAEVPGVENFHGPDGLAPFLSRTEILVCLLPLTPATRGIINAKTLAQLPEGAFVINAARGGHVVEADLLAGLDSGHLAGASLDVFATEPLPDDDPLWSHAHVMVTPHIASLSVPASAAPDIAANIRRVEAGETPTDLVDFERGY